MPSLLQRLFGAGAATRAPALDRKASRTGPLVAHLSLGIQCYLADSKARAVREFGPYHLYFNHTLFSHGNFSETDKQRATGYSSAASTDYVSAENRRAAAFLREDFRGLTMDDVARLAETLPWGTPQEVTERLIAAADEAGAETVQISLNRGVLPHDMFMEQIRWFARDVLPALHAHQVTRVPAADEIAA